MAKEEVRDDDWGDKVAGWTWLLTMILAAMFVGAVFLFILR